MPGMRSEDDILRAFEGLDTVPGSKKPRRELTDKALKQRARILGESNGWDAKPIIKTIQGVETEVFTVGALAQAIEKEVVTIRHWEKKGYFPMAPYRLRSKSLQGKKVNGNRVYTRELIEIVIEEFQKRGLLGVPRIEWTRHEDLTEAIVLRWRKAMSKEQ
jgi:hypothetical protein